MSDRRIHDREGGPVTSAARGEPVTLLLDGDPVRAYRGESVAVGLFASGAKVLSRSLKYHRPRSFFCLAGHCGSCLMRIDGQPNVKSCQAPSQDGVEISAQNAWPSAEHDVLGVVDWLYPSGMDHHRMMTSSRPLNAIMQKVARQMSGLGTLPDAPPTSLPPVREERFDVLVVGAGPAGLAAARASAEAGARTLVIDAQSAPGGSLFSHPAHAAAAASSAAAAAAAAGAELGCASALIGYYPEDQGGVAAVRAPDALRLVRAKTTIYATGGYDQNALFANNDRPGILAARAVGQLLVRHAIRPGERAVVLGATDYARTLASALRAANVEVTEVDGVREKLVRARGRAWVTGVDVATETGKTRRIACDLVAVASLPAPASEPARMHGCTVTLRPERGGFCVDVGDDGQTSVAGVFACGDVTGFLGPAAAAEHGARVGKAAARG